MGNPHPLQTKMVGRQIPEGSGVRLWKLAPANLEPVNERSHSAANQTGPSSYREGYHPVQRVKRVKNVNNQHSQAFRRSAVELARAQTVPARILGGPDQVQKVIAPEFAVCG